MAFKLYTNKSSLDNKYSRFVATGSAKMDGIFLSYWDNITIPDNPSDDIIVMITSEVAYRPDKIAKIVYDREDLMSIILQYNNIIDINEELGVGVKLKLPSYDRMFLEILP